MVLSLTNHAASRAGIWQNVKPSKSEPAVESVEVKDKSAQSFARPDAAHFKAQVAPAFSRPKFGHILTEMDYTVSPNPDHYINSYMASKTLRALALRHMAKREQGDNSTLKLVLNSLKGLWETDESALAEGLLLLDSPVDVLIDSFAGPGSLPALLMARLMGGTVTGPDGQLKPVHGRRFMNRNALLTMGPLNMRLGGTNHNTQVGREGGNETFQERVRLVALATGETDFEKISKDLNGQRQLNALQALTYGKHGLIDAILIGEDKVLTRQGLEAFFQKSPQYRDNPKQAREFLSDSLNLDQIVRDKRFQDLLIPLASYSPASIVPNQAVLDEKRPSHYSRMKDILLEEKDATLGEDLLVGARLLGDQKVQFMPRIPFLDASVSAMPDLPAHLQMENALTGEGLFYDDAIIFNDSFTMETAHQIVEGLKALKQKKLAEKDPSHIKIFINSPGGDIRAGLAIDQAIDGLGKIKTDVIVNGMAASCGAWLLANASGNKLATPMSRIMIHQPSTGYTYAQTNELANQFADNIEDLNKHIAGVIARTTGRDPRTVKRELTQDTWLNTLEAMFYGSLEQGKGLLDGIVVGPNKVITREDVLEYLKTEPKIQAYLTENFGKENNVEKYLEHYFSQFMDPKKDWQTPDLRDPFANSLKTIFAVALRSGRKFSEVDKLRGSATRKRDDSDTRPINQFIIGQKPMMMGGFGDHAASSREKETQHPPELSPGQIGFEVSGDSSYPKRHFRQ
jgi:ATP-dependent Clp protease protease subunit